MQQQVVKFKKHMNTQLERMDKKTSVALVTISELKTRMHLLETALETSLDYDPHEDQPMWMSLEELVELNPPEDNVLFHEEQGKLETPNEQHHMEADLAIGGELRENQDNTHRRLSPPRMYIPGGAERSDSSRSSNSTGEEETVEEGLARFFSNPSYRATDPVLQQPEEPEEDWGDTPPVLIPIPITPGPPPQTTRAIKRQRYLKRRRERKRQNEWEGNQN